MLTAGASGVFWYKSSAGCQPARGSDCSGRNPRGREDGPPDRALPRSRDRRLRRGPDSSRVVRRSAVRVRRREAHHRPRCSWPRCSLVSVVVRARGQCRRELVQNEWKVTPSEAGIETIARTRSRSVTRAAMWSCRSGSWATGRISRRSCSTARARGSSSAQPARGKFRRDSRLQPRAERDSFLIPRLFRYPSELHLGEFVE